MNENQMSQNEIKEKKVAKNKKLLIIGIVIVSLLAVLLGVYKFVINSPKNVFLRAINNEYKQLEKMIDLLDGSDKANDDTLIIASTLDFDIAVQEGILTDDQLSLLNEINALNLTMNTQYDSKNKQLGYAMNLKHNTSDLFSLGLYGKTSSFYLDLKNYFDKYIEIPVEDYESLFENQNQNVEDVKYIMSFLKNSFLNNLEKKDFKETKETIQLGSEKVKTTKIAYVFTEQSTKKLVSKVMEDMKNDEKFIESLSSVSGEEKEELKKSIENAIDNLEDVEESNDEDSIEIAVYTKGIIGENVQFSMITRDDDYTFEIRYSNYKDVKRFSMLEGDETILNIVNEKEKDDTYKTTVTANTLKLVVNSSKKDDDWSHTYKLTESESKAIISGEVTTVTKDVTKDKEYTTDTKFTAGIGVEGMEDVITFEITSNSNLKFGEDVIIPDTSNSILYTSLTEEQINNIVENILNNQNLLNFINKISTYIDSEDTYDDSDYYMYDYDDINY